MTVNQTLAALDATIKTLEADAWLTVQAWMLDQTPERLQHLADLRNKIDLLKWARDAAPMAFDEEGYPTDSDHPWNREGQNP